MISANVPDAVRVPPSVRPGDGEPAHGGER